jgi:hypothetical protein
MACKTSPSQIVSPRVVGRVVDAQTRQPIKDVTVRRGNGSQARKTSEVRHGGEMMQAPDEVNTRADGTFALASVKDLGFGSVGWYIVTVTFEHPRYQSFTASYTQTNAVVSAGGETEVKTGDVTLMPVSK